MLSKLRDSQSMSERDSESLDVHSLEELGAQVEEVAAQRVLERISWWCSMGASTPQALDMVAVKQMGLSAAEWARATDRQPSSVRQSVQRARESLNESVEEGEASSQVE